MALPNKVQFCACCGERVLTHAASALVVSLSTGKPKDAYLLSEDTGLTYRTIHRVVLDFDEVFSFGPWLKGDKYLSKHGKVLNARLRTYQLSAYGKKLAARIAAPKAAE